MTLAHAIAVVNARISDRSFPRYRLVRRFMRSVLDGVDAFLAQSEEDARRLRAMGAAAERVAVSGNLKFDLRKPQETAVVVQLRAALQRAGAGRVIVCGSTLEGEEKIVLHAFQRLLTHDPALVMVLAPRHPERFAAVAELLRCSVFLSGGALSGAGTPACAAACSCWTALANSPPCTRWPMLPSSAAAWCRGADITF